MDVAYDHVQEETYPSDEESASKETKKNTTLNTEFQEAFKAVSSSPWGAKLGGFFGQVKKQGESYLSEAQKEYNTASTQASKGLADLRSNIVERTKNLDLSIPQAAPGASASYVDPTITLPEQVQIKKDAPNEEASASQATSERPESLPADIVKEATSLVHRFRLTASQRLKEIEKAEDAADEALLKFGTNIKNFLREAVVVSAPEAIAGAMSGNTKTSADATEVLFETADAEGKRVFHSSRFDAQLHVIHSTAASFTQDPDSGEYAPFAAGFDIERQTEAIARDLETYEELRRAMERLVPEKVEYAAFWRRYYFLRKVVEEEDRRRKEVLKGAVANPEEEISWDDDDEDDDEAVTPNGKEASQSTTTLNPPAAKSDHLKPVSPRRSNEEDGKSVADSDASYDIVSGTTSKTPGSPKEDKKVDAPAVKEEESDEEDWE